MRLERTRPLTWVLATVAGWALLAWLLALLGMGGRIAPVEHDPSLAQSLPRPGATPESRLQGPGDYAEAVRRPLFFTSRQPLAFVIQGEQDNNVAADSAFDYVLTGVLIAPTARLAMLQKPDGSDGPTVAVGDEVEGHPGWRLSSVAARSALFTGPEGERSLELRRYMGDGPAMPGQMPPPAASPAPPPPSAPISGGVPPATADSATAAAAAVAAEQAEQARRNTPPTRALPNTPEQQAQIDAIRRRIEARRAQLQVEPQNQNSER